MSVKLVSNRSRVAVGSPCTLGDCTSPVVARGWCRKHYLRWYKTGDPLATRTPVVRPGLKGARHHEPGEHNYTRLDTPCREWCGLRERKGYGIYKRRRIHRWIWEQANGPIPQGLVVMHLCDNPPCFRLDHLRLGTIADNQADMKAKGRGRNASSAPRPQQKAA